VDRAPAKQQKQAMSKRNANPILSRTKAAGKTRNKPKNNKQTEKTQRNNNTKNNGYLSPMDKEDIFLGSIHWP